LCFKMETYSCAVRFKRFCAFNLFYLKKKDFLSSIGCIKLRSAFVFLSLSLIHPYSLTHTLSLTFSLSLYFAFVARTGPCKFVRRRPGGGTISCGLISDRVDRSISYPLRVCSMFIKYWSAPRNDNRFLHFPVRCPYALIFVFNCYRHKRSYIKYSAAGTEYRSRNTD